MKVNRLPDYLDHILNAAQQAHDYVNGMDKAAFLADKRTQQAVIMNLVIIGEAATQLLQHYSDFCNNTRMCLGKI